MNDTCIKDADEQCFHNCEGCSQGRPVQAVQRTCYMPDWYREVMGIKEDNGNGRKEEN